MLAMFLTITKVDWRKYQTLEYHRILSGTIHRKALIDPHQSVFWQVYNSGQNEALIQLCGFHKLVFDKLANLFTPLYDKYTPLGSKIVKVNHANGRKRVLNVHSCLGLVLAWLRSRGPSRTLCMMFGIGKSTFSVWLRYGKRILIYVLFKMKMQKLNYQLMIKFINMQILLIKDIML